MTTRIFRTILAQGNARAQRTNRAFARTRVLPVVLLLTLPAFVPTALGAPPSPPTAFSPGSTTESSAPEIGASESFSWSAVANAAGYILYMSKSPYGGSNIVLTRYVSGTSVTITKSEINAAGGAATQFRWGVTAYNSVGEESAQSNVRYIRATPPPPNQAPTCSLTSPPASTTATAGQAVTFRAACSDPEGQWYAAAWAADDHGSTSQYYSGSSSTSWSPAMTYAWSTPGTKSVGMATVDMGNAQSNQVWWSVVVTAPPQPNLVASSLSFSPDPPQRGQDASVTCHYANAGSLGTGGSFTVKVSVDGTERTATASALAAGASDARTLTFGSFPAGAHAVACAVDAGQSIAESNEDDNAVSLTKTWGAPQVSVAAASSPTGDGVRPGTAATDAATFTGTGPTPTGTATFHLCGPTEVTPAGCVAGTQVGSAVTLSAGRATSSPSTATTVLGRYCWRVAYSGDAAYDAVTYTNPTTQCFTTVGPLVLGFGDSVTAGHGLGGLADGYTRGAGPTGRGENSPHAYPGVVARLVTGSDDNARNFAVSGACARAADEDAAFAAQGVPPAAPGTPAGCDRPHSLLAQVFEDYEAQKANVPRGQRIVVMSVGANDIEFDACIQTMMRTGGKGLGPCDDVGGGAETNLSRNLAAFSANLDSALSQLRASPDFPADTKFVLLRYYNPFPAEAAPGTAACQVWAPMAAAALRDAWFWQKGDFFGASFNQTWLPAAQTLAHEHAEHILQRLNAVITTVAQEHGVLVAAPDEGDHDFADHDMCRSDRDAVDRADPAHAQTWVYPTNSIVEGHYTQFGGPVPDRHVWYQFPRPEAGPASAPACERAKRAPDPEEVPPFKDHGSFPLVGAWAVTANVTVNCMPHPTPAGHEALARAMKTAIDGKGDFPTVPIG